ncbi:hypothetical protein MHBO_001608 [Bonamia ostreae]|uniref:Pre-mRNA-splicing factor 18 n=1 Tax=Bonamia ostreae TaxID=126728 RepID=A0ABV2AKQ1_9EUKA
MNQAILEVIAAERKRRKKKEKDRSQKKAKTETENCAKSESKSPNSKSHNEENRFYPQNSKFSKISQNSKYRNSNYVINRLREMEEPIKLFDESDLNRIKRLKIAELNLHEKKTSSKGIRNVFRDIQEKVEMNMHKEKSVSGKKKRVPAFVHKKPTAHRANFDCAEFFILAFFKQLLAEWEDDLEQRPMEEKRSREGKHQSAIYLQTAEYLRPFFEQLANRECAADISEPVERIVMLMQQREYVMANNEYLTMSIGNAPWPMGLTMVSIHERKSRSKIYSNQIAHILNDEETRKYIQCIKRLMTFCQERYPPDTADKKF